MTAIASPGVVYDPFVQVFGTIFVGLIGLMFVARMALLIVELRQRRQAERIEVTGDRFEDEAMLDGPEPDLI